ncbi:sensor histidine kinase [Mucilaginibacter celer]|uniref:histidine kinase n=1 Tax=Mucilaginibacter celer TaxID=2305508 RepID=A0A494VNP6_9SPHI|nr:sensor histidine kinase [Mucilaginibacter celer]AYL95371.1 sensor histidine kinase [Mucilaginibacter celer]
MKRPIFTFFMLLFTIIARGQYFSRHDADSIRATLINIKANNSRIHSLLNLANYNITKAGEYKADLDSAAEFIRQADALNRQPRSNHFFGYSNLLKAKMYNEYGQKAIAKSYAEQATTILSGPEDKFYLFIACIELTKYYNVTDAAQLKTVDSLINKAFMLQWQSLADQKETAYGIVEFANIFIPRYSIFSKSWQESFLNKMAALARRVGDKADELWARQQVSQMHMSDGRVALAEKEVLEILKGYQAIHHPDVYFTYDLLCLVYMNKRDYHKALYYAYETIKSPDAKKDTAALINYFARFTTIYSALDNQIEGVKWLRKMQELAIAARQIHWIYETERQLSAFQIKNGKAEDALKHVLFLKRKYPPTTNEDKKLVAAIMGKCFAAKKNYALAEKYFMEVVRLYKLQIKNKEAQNGYLFDYSIAMFYLDWKHYTQAEKYFKQVLYGDPGVNTNPSYKNLFKGLFKVDSAAGRFSSAINYLQRYQRLNDSAFNIAKNRQVEELEINYDTEQKKKDIKLLQEKAKLQQAILKHAENTKNWIIAAAGILLLLLGTIYNMYLQKQKSNNLITYKNNLLQHLLTEKEWLLKEVHHRVKNNLHTVICLLESQAVYLENDALKAIESSQHRIYAMSLIHQKLYQSDDIKTIDMSLYLPEFVQYLNDSFGTQRQVRFQLDIEPIQLGVSQAIPLALIINEAVTNSIKYAFAPDTIGIISISMNQRGQDISLIIADNGIGLNPILVNMPLESLGLKLMNGLSEDINARIKIENNQGTRISIVFNIDQLQTV